MKTITLFDEKDKHYAEHITPSPIGFLSNIREAWKSFGDFECALSIQTDLVGSRRLERGFPSVLVDAAGLRREGKRNRPAMSGSNDSLWAVGNPTIHARD